MERRGLTSSLAKLAKLVFRRPLHQNTQQIKGIVNQLEKTPYPPYSGLPRVSPKLFGAQDTQAKPEYDGGVI
ncbi:hypothetical protein AKG09_03285 [Neisseria sp. 83E34]|nr:hypothetical protein AKG09_03285 [Neisseria sp. 83E34]